MTCAAGFPRSTTAVATLALVGVLAVACTSAGRSRHEPDRTTSTPPIPSPTAPCPITIPNRQPPPASILGEALSPDDPRWHGNGTLWIYLPLPVPTFRDPDTGLIWQKTGWWRAIAGQVELSAHPTDGSPATFTYHVSNKAQPGVVSSTLHFSRTGCWTITATLGASILNLVVDVPEPSTPSGAATR